MCVDIVTAIRVVMSSDTHNICGNWQRLQIWEQWSHAEFNLSIYEAFDEIQIDECPTAIKADSIKNTLCEFNSGYGGVTFDSYRLDQTPDSEGNCRIDS